MRRPDPLLAVARANEVPFVKVLVDKVCAGFEESVEAQTISLHHENYQAPLFRTTADAVNSNKRRSNARQRWSM